MARGSIPCSDSATALASGTPATDETVAMMAVRAVAMFEKRIFKKSSKISKNPVKDIQIYVMVVKVN